MIHKDRIRLTYQMENYNCARLEVQTSKLWPMVCALGSLACNAALHTLVVGQEVANQELDHVVTSPLDRRRKT